MRPARFLAVVVLALAAAGCGSSGARQGPIEFGISGGNLRAYRVTIQPNGSVRVRGSGRTARRQISPARVRQLGDEIRQANLASRRCTGVLPDMAAQYISVGGRTVMVHGDCEAAFERVWNDLSQAVASRS